MKTKHTPGPWRSGDMFNTVFGPKSENPSPATIATIMRGNKANALLIAAAPELITAMISVLPDLERFAAKQGPGPDARLDAFKATLTKAGIDLG